MLFKCVSLAVLLGLAQSALSQAKINEIDALVIQVKAKRLVESNLSDLYNFVAGSEMEASDFDRTLKSSFSDSDPLFDIDARIDDDTDPAKKQDGQAARDEVSTYLKKLNLYYIRNNAGDANSIELISQKVSRVKEFQKRMYLKVYFISNFKGSSRTTKSPYSPTNRVAEISVSKKDSSWITKIVRIDFFRESDTVNDFENDMILERDPSFIGIDSVEAARRLKSQADLAKQKEQEQRIMLMESNEKKYTKLIAEGNESLALKDYTTALKKYSDAYDVKPYDHYPLERISNARMEQQKSERTNSLLFDGYVEKAKRAANRRDRTAALDFYRMARERDPEKAKAFDADLRALDVQNESLSKMEELYRIGRYKDAIAEYTKFIKPNKDNRSKDFSDYYNGRGKCYYKTMEYTKAKDDFSKAIDLDRENEDARINRSLLYKTLGNYVDAITDRRQAIGIDKENPVNYVELADLRILNGSPVREVIAELDASLGKTEALQTVPDLYLKKGQLLSEDRQWKKAYDDLTIVITIDPANAVGFYNRGLVLIQLNKIDSASKDFESARKNELDPERVKSIADIAANYMRKAKVTTVYDSAIIYVSNAIAVNPYSDQYRFEKGDFLFSGNEYEQAIDFYTQALEINKSHIDGLYKRGLAYHLMGENQKAVNDLKDGAVLNPADYKMIKAVADAQSALGDYSNSILRYGDALKLMEKQKGIDNVFAEIYDSLGKAYYQLKNYDASVDALKSAIRRNENFADAYFNRGRSYFFQGKLEDATADLSKAVSINNSFAEWNYYAGKSFKAAGKFQQSADYFSSTIKQDSTGKFDDAIYQRGNSYFLLENYDVALKDYLEVQKRKKDSLYDHFNFELGNIYINTKHADEALAYYKKQYMIDSTSMETVYAIGIAYVQKGLIDEAIPYLERMLQSKGITTKKMKNNKLLATISEDKRFTGLLKKYK